MAQYLSHDSLTKIERFVLFNRKYPEIKGYWLYVHHTPDNWYYPGCSMQPVSRRWKVGQYRKTGLEDSIKKFGWDNIEHIILMDGLTKEEALYWEDRLICMYRKLGCCINKQRSGGNGKERWRKEKEKDYNRQYYEENKERLIDYQHSDKMKEYKKEYRKEHQFELNIKNKQRMKEYRFTNEYKIYYRVTNYNRNHIPIETALEAKQKYLETGYIPSYIKNNDLI